MTFFDTNDYNDEYDEGMFVVKSLANCNNPVAKSIFANWRVKAQMENGERADWLDNDGDGLWDNDNDYDDWGE